MKKSSFAVLLTTAIMGLSEIPAQANIWDSGTTVIPGGGSVHWDFRELWLNHADFWLALGDPNAAPFGPVDIRIDLLGSIHLEPGETFTKHISGDWPFQDTEYFGNIGNGDQTLIGEYTIDSLPPVAIGPTVVPVGETEHITIDVDVPTPPPSPNAGRYELWKEITNTSNETNWWSYQESLFLPGFTFPGGGAPPIDIFHINWWNAHITDIEIWIENPNPDPVVIPFEIHITTPEPSALVGLGALGFSFLNLASRKRKDKSKEKDLTKIG